MRSLLDRIREGLVLGDGAIGTMLMQSGLPAGQPPERWTLEHPDRVAAVARAYAAAGSEILTTNTFGASPMRLAVHGLQDRIDEINARGVAAAREGAGPGLWVAGSVGPCGRLLAPLGDARPEEVRDGFRRQVAALAAAGADLIIIETMTDLEEASLAAGAVRDEAPGLPIIVTMTFEVTKRGAFTIMGTSVPAACSRLEAEGASVVGANCGAGADAMRHVAAEFAAATRLPLAFQPNAGLPVQRGDRLEYPQPPEIFAAEAAPLRGIAAILGGCCGTTPDHIRALRSLR
jgi:5-methyltetrahydrofolate--homocysteine methyltransferase